MSTYGFPDGQKITQWIGQPLAEATAAPIGAGTINVGPLTLANFASIIVAVHAVGGQVTVKVAQAVSGGPASLTFTQSFIATAGETIFQAIVLLADQVTIELDGGSVGTTVDYAVYPSNSTTNTQAVVSASLLFQHNDVTVASEPALDFEDVDGFAWSLTDDAANTRVKVTPPRPALVPLADTTLGVAAASIDFQAIPQTYRHLLLELALQSDQGSDENVYVRLDNDATNAYRYQGVNSSGTSTSGIWDGGALANVGLIGIMPSNAAGLRSGSTLTIPDYTNAARWKVARGEYASFGIGFNVGVLATLWQNTAAVSRVTLLPAGGSFNAGSRATLYGMQ